MIAKSVGVLFLCGVVFAYPSPHPAPAPAPAPAPNPNYVYGGPGYGVGYGGYSVGLVEEVITPPVIPPVLNTVDVYDISTLGVIPAPPVEYVYPAVGYEAFGLGGYPEIFGGIVNEYGYGSYGLGGYGPGGYVPGYVTGYGIGTGFGIL